MDYTKDDFVSALDIGESINVIQAGIRSLDNVYHAYRKKYSDINDKIEVLNTKKGLKLESTLKTLRFQNQLIFNEIQYIRTQSNAIKGRLLQELTSIAEKLLFIVMSISNLNKDISTEKTVNHIQKLPSNAELNETIIFIKENLHHISEQLLDLKQYNEKISQELTDGNYHCTTLDLDMRSKRMIIFVEFKRMNDYYSQIIRHFAALTKAAAETMIQSSLFRVLVQEAKKTDLKDSAN